VHLSELLRRPVVTRSGERIGRVDDVIVRLRDDAYPLVTGLVARIERRRIFVPASQVASLDDERVELARNKVNLRAFERYPGEFLLREDVLGHRLINVGTAELVRASDVELRPTDSGWELSCVDTRPSRVFGVLGHGGGGHPCVDWKAFEPLVGHLPSAGLRSGLRLRRLRAAQLADILEDASRGESAEILDHVHEDPELEADVFEELDPDVARKLFGSKSDAEVAGVLARMGADDAADAIADLPQERRQPVLDALPAPQRTKVLVLMGFNPASAGGLMNIDAVTVPEDSTVAEALQAIGRAGAMQPEAITTVHAVNDDRCLVGVAGVVRLLQAAPGAVLGDVVERDPVRVSAETDVTDIALLMADYNLITVPVVDDADRLLGVVTVDDVLEAIIPDDWRRREPLPHPEHPVTGEQEAQAGVGT
jgi:sporulation protein YlmC with PRC-barrel domain